MTDLKKYSTAQREAILTFGKDVTVLAGAGSGKTSVLVERFLQAAAQAGGTPERVLAITFTEKAAQEMKSRLVALCEERNLGSLRKSLESASISTIDSFCAKILRENSIEAGVDPYFQILGDGESEMLMNRLLDKLFQSEAENPNFLKLLSDYGEEVIRLTLMNYYFKTRSRRDARPLFKMWDAEPLYRETIQKIHRNSRDILAETTGSDLGITESELRLAATELEAVVKWSLCDLNWEHYESLENTLKKIKKRGRLKELAEETRNLVELILECIAQKMGKPLKAEFVRIYYLFENLYEAEKERLASFDFTDLLHKTCTLLDSDQAVGQSLREYLRGHFSQILVDEYQDTSPLQSDLMGLLKQEGNLFVVGDEKQSIYGFREADPAILRQKKENSHAISLSENYRSRPEVLAWVNAIFKEMFPLNLFQELEARRVFRSSVSHGVEILCVVRDKDEIEGMEEARVSEAASIAKRVLALVEGGYLIEEKNGCVRPIKYGDIRLLLRSTTASHLYEKEFLDLGIPYYVVKGKGFYDKPEVKDLIHFLKWIESPDLDVSLACILRSPFFGVSDDGLFWLAQAAKKENSKTPLFHGLSKVSSQGYLSEKEKEKFILFEKFQVFLRANKNRYKISEILEKLLSETCYEAKILTKSEGRRKVANVRKFVEMTRALEEKNIFGVGDFVRHIEGLALRENSQEEAKIEPELADAVTLSTIHAAKGLEFPCVILADLGRTKSGFDEKFISSDDLGLGMKIKNPLTLEYIKDVAYERIRAQIVQKEKEEENRLLYVGMTRAQELLILSGSAALDLKTDEIKKDGSWMGQILKIVGQDPRKISSFDFRGARAQVLKPGGKSSFNRALQPHAYVDAPGIREKILDGILLTDQDAKSAGLGFDEVGAEEIEKRLRIPCKPYISLRGMSVTDLLKEENKDKEPDRPSLGFSDDENLPRNEFGTIFHKMMELSLYRVRQGKILGIDTFQALTHPLNAKEKEEAFQGMIDFWRSSLGQEIRHSLKCYPELPFIYKTSRGLLKGQMDLVFQDKKGDWIILDYKTNRISPDQIQEAAQEYEFQLGLYALVFQELYGQTPAKGILYFSTLQRSHDFFYSAKILDRARQYLADAQSS